MSTRITSWLGMILQSNPDHTRESRYVREYEFTARGVGNPKTHEGTKRVFDGDYQTRGPYRPDEE